MIKKKTFTKIHTLSTIKSIASTISPSTLSVTKFPINIFFNTNDGKIQKLRFELIRNSYTQKYSR